MLEDIRSDHGFTPNKTKNSYSDILQIQQPVQASSNLIFDSVSRKKAAATPSRRVRKVSNKWVLWYNPGHSGKSFGQSEQLYLSDVKRASTFKTSSELHEFLTHWREELDRENGFSRYFSLYMFRNGIKPLWEHPQNISGGSFYYILSANSREEGFKLWLRLCADALEGKFETDPPCKQLNGIAISIDKSLSSKFSYFIKITVWNENCRAKKYIEFLRDALIKDYFGGSCSLAYRRHESRIRRNKDVPEAPEIKHTDDSPVGPSPAEESEEKKVPFIKDALVDVLPTPATPQQRKREAPVSSMSPLSAPAEKVGTESPREEVQLPSAMPVDEVEPEIRSATATVKPIQECSEVVRLSATREQVMNQHRVQMAFIFFMLALGVVLSLF